MSCDSVDRDFLRKFPQDPTPRLTDEEFVREARKHEHDRDEEMRRRIMMTAHFEPMVELENEYGHRYMGYASKRGRDAVVHEEMAARDRHCEVVERRLAEERRQRYARDAGDA